MNPPAKTATLARSDESVDWTALRDDFPILRETVNGHPLVYLDNAASSQKPHQVIDAVRRYYKHDNANVHRGIHELSNRATEAYEGARQRVADYLNAGSREEIIFTRGTTEGLNLVANTWALDKLRQGVDALNAEGRERLLKAFEQVNEHFKALFTALFRGGQAELRLVDADDPLQAGLEIMAQPPGKKLGTLNLMSGGEQALTAAALELACALGLALGRDSAPGGSGGAADEGEDAEIDELVDRRLAARESRDFAEADRIRDELAARGIALEDTPHGTSWRRG